MSERQNPIVSLHQPQFTYLNRRGPSKAFCFKNFEIFPNDRVFIHGPSGSGKSTLLGLMAGVLMPQKGGVQLMGHDLNTLSGTQRDALRGENLGIIFQAFNLIPHLSALDNIMLPCFLNPKRRLQCSQSPQQDALFWANQLGLEGDLLSKKAHQLSIGQQQRVAAARAFIGSPKLVIADEPTSALDHDNRSEFMKNVFFLCHQQRAALVFVSHDLQLSQAFQKVIPFNDLIEFS